LLTAQFYGHLFWKDYDKAERNDVLLKIRQSTTTFSL